MSGAEPVHPSNEGKRSLRTGRTLDGEAFESLLRLLDPDRETAGLRYEDLRRRLTMFFENRAQPNSDHLVDVVMDRVACKLKDGADIPAADSVPYIFGIARMIALEEHGRQMKAPTTPLTWDLADPRQQPSERELQCLDHCLGALEAETRSTILAYYHGQGSKKLHSRTGIAARLGITHAALANRTWRIRTRLAKCVRACVEQDS